MEVIRIPMAELTPDPNNAKDHPAWQVEQIKRSIEQFGNLDPIGVWGDNNLIVEGHGRFLALQELGYTEAECIRLDWLSDEERRAYALVHNQTTMNSGFDALLLDQALQSITEIDMSLFGFDEDGDAEETESEEETDPLDALPESRVMVCTISLFGVKSDRILYAKIEPEMAEKILERIREEGGVSTLIDSVIGALS